jgi:hypothetical protein
LIGNFKALSSRRGARIFRALSKVDPAATIGALTRTFMGRDHENLLTYKEGRRDVIFTLEHLIYLYDFFLAAAHVLAQLAVAENEAIANNATGVLAARFIPFGAQTEAPGDLRLQFIDELVRSGDAAKLLVAAKCLAAGLDSSHMVVSTWIEPPELGRPINEWRPTAREASAYAAGLFERAKQVSAMPGEAGEVIRHAVAVAIRGLVGREQFAELEDAVRALNQHAPKPWKDAVDQLHAALRYEAKDNPEVRERVEALLAEITPRYLPDRLRLIVTDPPVDFEERDGSYIDRGAERAAEFAAEIVRTDEAANVLPLVVRGNQQKGIEFGEGLLIAADYADSLLSDIIAQTAAVPSQERNVGPLAGALVALARHDRARYERVMNDMLQRGLLLDRLAHLTAIVRPTDADILRLLVPLREKQLEASQFEAFAYGSALEADRVPRSGVRVTLDAGWASAGNHS